MIRTSRIGSTHGHIDLKIEAFGTAKHELGEKAFAAKLDQLMNELIVNTLGLWRLFTDGVQNDSPEPGTQRQTASASFTLNGTTVSFEATARLNVLLNSAAAALAIKRMVSKSSDFALASFSEKPEHKSPEGEMSEDLITGIFACVGAMTHESNADRLNGGFPFY